MHIDNHTHHVPLPYIAKVSENPNRFEAKVVQTSSDTYEMYPSFWTSARFASRYRFDPRYYDWKARVDHMDSAGIGSAVVSANQSLNYGWAPLDVAVEVAQVVNDDLAEGAKRFPGRINGIASVPLQDPDAAVREATRAIDDLSLRGIQVLSNIEGTNLADAGLEQLFECVAGLGVPLFIHPYGALNHERMTPHFLVNVIGFPTEQAMVAAGLIFDGVLDRHPNLKVFLGHGGGSFPYVLGRIERGMQAFPDLMPTQRPFRDYLDQIFVDTLIHDDAALKYLIQTVGIGHVVFGTDWPYWMQDIDVVERVERVLTSLGHDVSTLSNNASQLFGPMDRQSPMTDGQL